MTRPTTDDVIVLAASLAGIVLGAAAMTWAAWQLLKAGVGR